MIDSKENRRRKKVEKNNYDRFHPVANELILFSS